jgi:hypothetical protein
MIDLSNYEEVQRDGDKIRYTIDGSVPMSSQMLQYVNLVDEVEDLLDRSLILSARNIVNNASSDKNGVHYNEYGEFVQVLYDRIEEYKKPRLEVSR